MLPGLTCLLWLHFVDADGSHLTPACPAMCSVISPQIHVQKLVHVSQALLDLKLLILCCLCIALFTPSLSAVTSSIVAFLVPNVSLTAQLHKIFSTVLPDKHAWVCLQS